MQKFADLPIRTRLSREKSLPYRAFSRPWAFCPFYGLSELMLISWPNFDVRKLRGLNARLGLGYFVWIVDLFRRDPKWSSE